MMFGMGAMELALIVVLALIIFGPGKLPGVGKAIGKAISEFRSASKMAGNDEKGEAEKEKQEDGQK